MLTLQKPHIPASFNMNLVINKCVTAVILSNFSGHYLRNLSTLDIGVFWVISVYFKIRNILPNLAHSSWDTLYKQELKKINKCTSDTGTWR